MCSFQIEKLSEVDELRLSKQFSPTDQGRISIVGGPEPNVVKGTMFQVVLDVVAIYNTKCNVYLLHFVSYRNGLEIILFVTIIVAYCNT